MTSEVGRRVFVGSVAGGLPMLGLAAAQSAHTTHPSGGSHPMEKEIEAQLRAAIAQMQGPRADEGARRVAATLRLGAAHFKAQGADEAFKASARSAITTYGREGVLARANDRERLRSEVGQFGIATFPTVAEDVIADNRALDTILQLGVTPIMLRVADALDKLSEQMGSAGLLAVAARGNCPNHEPYTTLLGVLMAGMCLWTLIFCAVFTGMWAGTMLALISVYAYHGCYR